MNSLGKECDELKLQYDACFNYWFTERFLKGDNDESMCAQIFKVYQQCVKVSAGSLSILESFYSFIGYWKKSQND